MADSTENRQKRKNEEGEQQNVPRKRTSMREGGLERASYLDDLSPEAVENIVRYTSERPTCENWVKYVPRDLALRLLMSESAFASCCRLLFHSLSPDSCTGDILLLPALRDTLKEIRIDVNQEEFTTALEQCLISKFSQLKGIHLTDYENRKNLPLKEILSAHQETLKSLEIWGRDLKKEDTLAIAKFGRGLKSFSLLWARPDTALDGMWTSIGVTLQDLTFGYQDIDILPIMNSCKGLRNVTFCWFSHERHENIESMCKNLGSQLLSATFESCKIDSSRLGRIASACENVALSVIEECGCTAAALLAMGPRASFVNIDLSTDKQRLCGSHCEDCKEGSEHIGFPRRIESLRLAGERCVNLGRIDCVGSIARAPLEALVAQPKQLLTEFRGWAEDGVEDFVFEILTRNVSSLETFQFDGKIPPMPVLQAFVDASPALKTVLLNDRRCDQNEKCPAGELDVNVCTEVAKIFLQGRNMKELTVSCGGLHQDSHWEWIPDIKAHIPEQGRNVDLEICERRVFR